MFWGHARQAITIMARCVSRWMTLFTTYTPRSHSRNSRDELPSANLSQLARIRSLIMPHQTFGSRKSDYSIMKFSRDLACKILLDPSGSPLPNRAASCKYNPDVPHGRSQFSARNPGAALYMHPNPPRQEVDPTRCGCLPEGAMRISKHILSRLPQLHRLNQTQSTAS